METKKRIISLYEERQRKQFAERLRTLRKNARLTQAQLAEKAGMNKTLITRYETGGALPRPKAIEKLAAALEVSPLFLEYPPHIGFETAPLRAHGVNVIHLGNGWIRMSIPGCNEIEIPTATCNVLYDFCESETNSAFKDIISEYRINMFLREAYKWYQRNCVVPGTNSKSTTPDQNASDTPAE